MISPPAGAQKQRRRRLACVMVLGVAIALCGASLALLVRPQLTKQGYVDPGLGTRTTNLVLSEDGNGAYTLDTYDGYRPPAAIRFPPESGTPDPDNWPPKISPLTPDWSPSTSGGETYARADPPIGGIALPPRPEHLVLSVTYPGSVTLGDSIPITIVISSATIPEVRNGNIELTLDSPSLEWGDGRKRTVAVGERLPIDVNFSAGTKSTGTASIVVLAKAPDPIVLFTAAGANDKLEDVRSALATGNADGAAIDGTAQRAIPEEAIAGSTAAGARLNLDTRINVAILTKYAISDTTVHWIGIGGWVVSAVGAGTMLKALGGLLWNRRRQHVPDPLP